MRTSDSCCLSSMKYVLNSATISRNSGAHSLQFTRVLHERFPEAVSYDFQYRNLFPRNKEKSQYPVCDNFKVLPVCSTLSYDSGKENFNVILVSSFLSKTHVQVHEMLLYQLSLFSKIDVVGLKITEQCVRQLSWFYLPDKYKEITVK